MESNANILITGGTGFVGGHLIKALSKHNPKARISLLVRRTSNITYLKNFHNLRYLYGDLRDTQSLKRSVKDIDIIYHLAGVLGKHGAVKTVYRDVNVEGTRNILQACAEKKRIKQFIHLSSAGISGPNVDNADEDYPPNPSNVYERSKADAERIVFEYYHKMGLPVTVLRPEFLYGPGDMHTLGLFKAIKKKLFFLMDGGRSFLHPTYIEDLVHAQLACCGDMHAIGKIYLIAGERSITVKELAGLIAAYLGVKCINRSISSKTALLISRVFELSAGFLRFDPPITQSRVKFFTENRSYNISKAKKELGLSPLSLEEGIQRTIIWYKAHKYL